jgi:hypothetical protein
MSLFERNRTKITAEPETDASLSGCEERLKRAEVAATVAEQHTAYEWARATELLPDIKEEVGLEIEANGAKARLESAQRVDALAQRARDLREKVLARGGDASSIPEPISDLVTRKQEYAQAQDALAAFRERIHAKDQTLRERYGIKRE